MTTYLTPGVYREDIFLVPPAELRTGVPAFLGYAQQGQVNTPQMLALSSEFGKYFGAPLPDSYLAYAVNGFFENGGSQCYVVRLDDAGDAVAALCNGLAALAPLETIDLICAPDIMRPRQPGNLPVNPTDVQTMQAAVLKHCNAIGVHFAILDCLPQASVDEVLQQRQGLAQAINDPSVPLCPAWLQQQSGLSAMNGALYYPWVGVSPAPALTAKSIPPCGHIAGVYARTDERFGVYKAPANEVLESVLDLQVNPTDADQARLNPAGINCLRAFPGRGIRVWGARTLSRDPAWTYINVRRLFLTAGRWIERNLASVVFEPNDPGLWARINRELSAYFNDLFQRGALKGSTAQEAFYVKCDAETNPPEVRDQGMVVTEIGLAPTSPSEFVVVRIVQGPSGVTISV
jgi:phage tail sheath protein FI